MSAYQGIKDFDLNLIKTLDAVIREGNATKASQYLQVTPAAVSLALRRLQSTYDEVLFVRTKDGLAPTAKAKELHNAFLQAIQIVEATFEEGVQRPAKKEITILGNDITEPFYLAEVADLDIFERYLITHQSYWEHTADKAEESLLNGNADIILTFEKIDDERFQRVELDKFSNFCAICSRRNPLADVSKLSLYNFYAFNHVAFANENLSKGLYHKHKILQDTLDPSGKRKVKFRSDSVNGMVSIIERSATIGVIPVKLASFFKNQKNSDIALLALPDELKFNPLRLYAYWAKDNVLIADIESLITTLRALVNFRK